MKLNDSFVIREISGKMLLIPVKANNISKVPICANKHAKEIILSLLNFDNLNDVFSDLSKNMIYQMNVFIMIFKILYKCY